MNTETKQRVLNMVAIACLSIQAIFLSNIGKIDNIILPIMTILFVTNSWYSKNGRTLRNLLSLNISKIIMIVLSLLVVGKLAFYGGQHGVSNMLEKLFFTEMLIAAIAFIVMVWNYEFQKPSN